MDLTWTLHPDTTTGNKWHIGQMFIQSVGNARGLSSSNDGIKHQQGDSYRHPSKS
ncbi:hypothetical protein M0657_008460 [Pyricularia oryzae]|nr:hypothetical protein M0657_008460 [Pyricularia oryzae]KAI7923360.1 hypothetical protein M9X92_004352 [Pyricularia oryzae]QBZ59144.1 hypothetical protein PoMZ_04104 [Pyricularia oryzae]